LLELVLLDTSPFYPIPMSGAGRNSLLSKGKRGVDAKQPAFTWVFTFIQRAPADWVMEERAAHIPF
jgi:hypothetical protein